MNYLSSTLQRAIQRMGLTVADFERQSGLSNAAVARLKNSRPTPDTLDKILAALPDASARAVLASHLMDEAPTEDWRARTSVTIRESASLHEPSAPALDPSTPDAFERALEILRAQSHRPAIVKTVLSLLEALDLITPPKQTKRRKP